MTTKTLPLGPGLSRWEPVEEEPGYRSESVSGKRQFRSRGFTRWRVSLGWQNLTQAEADPILSFLRAHGESTAFRIERPDGGDDLIVRLAGPLEPWQVRRGLRYDIDIEVVEEK